MSPKTPTAWTCLEAACRRPDHWSFGIGLATMELTFDGIRRGQGRLRADGTIGYRIAG